MPKLSRTIRISLVNILVSTLPVVCPAESVNGKKADGGGDAQAEVGKKIDESSTKKSPPKHDPESKVTTAANEAPHSVHGSLGSFKSLAFPLASLTFSLASLLLAIITLVKVSSISKQVRSQALDFSREIQGSRQHLELLSREIAQTLVRRFDNRDFNAPTGSSPDEPLKITTKGVKEPVIPSPAAFGLLKCFLDCAGETEPVGGVIRVRLDQVASRAGCNLLEVRSALTSANTMFSASDHPILRRQNFLSVMESRTDKPGDSPFVAAISREALAAIRESSSFLLYS
jgi:hypothetical protein